MQINVISVGKLSGNFLAMAKDYAKMIKWRLKETEITYSKKLPISQIKVFETSLIEKQISNNSYKIILDLTGNQVSSEELSGIFQKQMMISKNIDFIIGGAFGFSDSLLSIVDFRMSMSKMTLPHQMVKVILLEQIYRSQTIIERHPYHK
jgi:23S rRNA (pseudouridine1915-N3)-methyltransferase